MDYIDPRWREAPRKAVRVLLEHSAEWSSIVDAYWVLRRHEDEVGVPVTYEIVEAAYREASRLLRRTTVHVPASGVVGAEEAAEAAQR